MDDRFTIEFYVDAAGRSPVERWMERDLNDTQLAALQAALRVVLAHQGIGVCGSEWGKQVVLLLGGYDKGSDPSAKRQRVEIARARKRLAEWKRRSG